MATLVKFVKSDDGEITAIFPQLKYNKKLYGNDILTCYSFIGQHSSCDTGWIKGCTEATKKEYTDLAEQLTDLGYELKILNKS